MTEITRELGRTGIGVFPVGLGGMQLSMPHPLAQDEAVEVIRAALDAGVNFIDTANVYCTDETGIGHNERLIDVALTTCGAVESIIVATKGGVDRQRRRVDATPGFLRQSCVNSLRALNRETITLYQLHSPDDDVPLEDSVGELARLQEEGKILHIGLCNVTLAEFQRAQRIGRIEAVQNCCNPFDPEDYCNGFLRACEEWGVSYLPHSVMGGRIAAPNLARQPTVVALAEKHGASPYAIIVAWHLSKSRQVIPIPGASRPASARSSAGAADLSLSQEDIRLLDMLHSGL